MNVSKLKGKIIEKGLNVERLAERIGIDRSSLYRKLNNHEKITVGDIEKIKDVLNLSVDDVHDIFLSK